LPGFLTPGTPTGHCINLLNKLILWFSKPVRKASVCRWQSAVEAQGGPFRHKTDTWHVTAVLWRWDWWTGSSGTDEHSYWTIPSHAGTTEQLYTPSPGDKAVMQTTITYPKNNNTYSNKKNCSFCYIIFYYFRYMSVLEDTMNLPMCALSLVII
jgi:hypothetical protein